MNDEKVTGEGTYACPICGCATPHAHSEEQIKEWREEQDVAPELCASCEYCRGDAPFIQRKAKRNESGFYFHYRLDHRGLPYSNMNSPEDSPVACEAQQIQTLIYDIARGLYVGTHTHDCSHWKKEGDCNCEFAQPESPAPMSAREFYEKVWSTREEVEKRPRHEQLLGTLDAAFNFAKSFAAHQPSVSQPRKKWNCFHCEFATDDDKEAAAHFGDRDDAEEFKPLCKWWDRLTEDERVETLQDTIQQLNDALEMSQPSEPQAIPEAELERVAEEIWQELETLSDFGKETAIMDLVAILRTLEKKA